MDFHVGIPLKNYTTMRIGGMARFVVDAHSPDDVERIYAAAATQKLPVYVLGGGSNTIAHDDGYRGIILLNRIRGFSVGQDTPDDTTITIGAGENWDEIVVKTISMGLSGIEALSAIPGTVGAAPVQNIGAYGQEVGDVVVSVQAYDSHTRQHIQLTAEACGFAYRHSVFRGDAQNRYCITSVTLRLAKTPPSPPFYAAIEEYFAAHNISFYTLDAVRDAVINIRSEKLPDPKLKPNSGSFFKNPIIEKWQLDDLLKQYPGMPHYEMPLNTYKLSAGWLIETAGFKGQLLHGMRVNEKNALVLINESATSYEDLSAAREEIRGKVRDTFHVLLDQEPLELHS